MNGKVQQEVLKSSNIINQIPWIFVDDVSRVVSECSGEKTQPKVAKTQEVLEMGAKKPGTISDVQDKDFDNIETSQKWELKKDIFEQNQKSEKQYVKFSNQDGSEKADTGLKDSGQDLSGQSEKEAFEQSKQFEDVEVEKQNGEALKKKENSFNQKMQEQNYGQFVRTTSGVKREWQRGHEQSQTLFQQVWSGISKFIMRFKR
eukprot:TRINITY_DN760_c0_g1_i3.p2 TRINITY_DN760_c0_g1~~TRINITY_DN760_c0_g1_i3.p2  ORF type:complete len:223 (-),score=33.61 TRINITY_DN760_c0_g1_i3:313-921(-)